MNSCFSDFNPSLTQWGYPVQIAGTPDQQTVYVFGMSIVKVDPDITGLLNQEPNLLDISNNTINTIISNQNTLNPLASDDSTTNACSDVSIDFATEINKFDLSESPQESYAESYPLSIRDYGIISAVSGNSFGNSTNTERPNPNYSRPVTEINPLDFKGNMPQQKTRCEDSATLSKKKKYQCMECGKSYAHSKTLKVHIRSIHNGEKPFQCMICKKSFAYHNSLRFHVVSHTGEKPYQCEICKKRFSQRSYLQKHIRIHTGEKPYQCKICEKSFAFADKLKRHTLTLIHTRRLPENSLPYCGGNKLI